MKQVGYQGYAQAEGFDPIRVSNANVEKIAAEGRRTIRGMEQVRDADMRNRRAYAQGMERKFGKEAQNRAQNKQLEDSNRALVNKWENINSQIKVQNYENEAKRWLAIADLSKTAFNTAQEILEIKEERDTMDEYNRAMMDGLPMDQQLSHAEAEHNLRIAGEQIEVQADMMQAKGIPMDSVEKVRNLNAARRYGRKKAYAEMAGQKWSSWMQEQFQTNTKTEVTVPDGQGGFKQVTPATATTATEVAAVQQSLFEDYLRQNDLVGAKPELLGGMFQTMRKANESYLAGRRMAEARASEQNRMDMARESFFESQTPENAYNLFLTGKRTIDPKTGAPGGFRAGRYAIYESLAEVDADGNLVVNDSELDDIANMTLPGQNKPFGEQYEREWAEIRRNRQDVVDKQYTRNERKEKRQHDEWTDQAVEWVLANPGADEEAIEGLMRKAQDMGNSAGVKRLSEYLKYTPEAQQDEYYNEEVFSELYLQGSLTRERVMTAPISTELKMKWADRAKQSEQMGVNKDTEKLFGDIVKNELRQKLGSDSVDKTVDGSYFLAVDQAMNKMKSDFFRAKRAGLDDQQAQRQAVDGFRAEVQKDDGAYAVNDKSYTIRTDSRGNKVRIPVAGKGFANFGINSSTYAQPTHGEVSRRLRSDPRGVVGVLREDVIIDPAEATRYLQGIKAGRRVAPPAQAQAIADMTGGKLSAYDVLKLQMQANGIEDPKVKPIENFQKAIDSEYESLLNYKPTPTRTDIALIGSGMPGIHRTPEQIHALSIIGKYESDSVGGYNAMNEGGANGGRTVVGYSGPSKARLGRDLTDMTVGEVMDLQKQGKIHAAGRYQFIGNTLPGVVKDAGIDRNAKFDKNTQDLLGLTLLRQRGIQPWIGPNDKATPGERRMVEAAARQPIQFAGTSPWRNSANMEFEVVEYLTGDPEHPSFRSDHGGRNYHEHIAFATAEQARKAAALLEARGIKTTELKGRDSVGGHAEHSYHYSGQAFDVPASQVPVGQEQELSSRVRAILRMN